MHHVIKQLIYIFRKRNLKRKKWLLFHRKKNILASHCEKKYPSFLWEKNKKTLTTPTPPYPPPQNQMVSLTLLMNSLASQDVSSFKGLLLNLMNVLLHLNFEPHIDADAERGNFPGY